MRTDDAARRRGFALIAVLWLLLALAVLAGMMLVEARSSRQETAGDVALLKARLLADGAIDRVILDLANGNAGRWRLDGAPAAVTLFGRKVEIQVESEAGKIDLNAAPAALLASLFQSAGLAPAEAEQLAARVAEWRAPLRGVGPDPAADPYRAAGRRYLPRHAPFRSVDELRLVIGMTDALQQKLAPVLTVYSGTPEVDRQVASLRVLGALAEAGDEFAARQREARQAGNAAGVDRLPAMGEALSIDARAETDGASATRLAVVRLTGDRREPYWVLEWR